MLSSKLQLLRLALLLCLYQLASTVFAAPQPPPFDVTPENTKLTAGRVVMGILLIAVGIFYCFFGRRFFRVSMFILGFYVGAVIAWIILQNAEPDDGYEHSAAATEAILVAVSIVAGLLCGALFLCFSTLVVWILGGLAGYALALFILSFGSGSLIHSRAGRIVFIVVFIIAGVVFTVCFPNLAIILGTAFIGAFSIILGIDMFARTGFTETVSSMQNVNKDNLEYSVSGRVVGMLIGLLVLFVLGTIVQWHFFRMYKFGYYDPAAKRRFGLGPWRFGRRNRGPIV